jgi:chromosome segregation ATPase
MFGFHREDVSSFIAKQSKQYEKRINELIEEQKGLEAELNAEKSAREAETALLQSFRAEQDKNEKSRKMVAEIIAKIQAEKSTLLSGAELCSNQFDEMKEGIGLLNQKLSDALSFRDKAKKFDQLANVLSGILSGEVRDAESDFSAEEQMEKMKELSLSPDPVLAQKESILRVAELLDQLADALNESKE